MKRIAFASLILMALAVTSGCGYALAGRGSFLPDYIRVVGIPAFENDTAVFNIDRELTDRVRTEFGSRGRYRVEPDINNVDAILTGRITRVAFDNTAYTGGSQAARVQLIVTATFEFRDVRENKVLWSVPSMVFKEEYEPSSTTTGGDPSAFFGQNAQAMERVAQNFARSIVTAILEAF